MKTGIIVCSHTGNTASVAEAVREKMNAAGKEAVIERIETKGQASPGSKDIELAGTPDLSAYDNLVFAAPVMAFSLAPAMKLCMNSLPSLNGKSVALLVTKQLKFNWTGGNRAISHMKKNCLERGAEVVGTGIIVWSSRTLKEDIEFIADEVAGVFS